MAKPDFRHGDTLLATSVGESRSQLPIEATDMDDFPALPWTSFRPF